MEKNLNLFSLKDLEMKEVVEELKEGDLEIYLLDENGFTYNLKRFFLYNEEELPDRFAENYSIRRYLITWKIMERIQT